MISEYRYSPLLLPTNIRLIRLLPSEMDSDIPRCDIFEYHLQHSDGPSHLYEALSYVWGNADKPCCININNQCLKITQNLYRALLHLRNNTFSLIIWIDAICINQDDEREKERQIPLMAEIYAKASCVVVWLGDAEDDGDRALEAIHLVGEISIKALNAELRQQAIPQLLQRQYFRRIWVKN